MNKHYWVYILYCENNCYYTGYTIDLKKRYEAHLNGTASKYTRSFKPLKIAQYWKVKNKSIAMQLENRIKKLSHAASYLKSLSCSNNHCFRTIPPP